MTKRHKRRSNNYKLIISLVCVAFVLTCAAVVTGGYAKSGYNLEVGKPSPVKFVANRDVVNTVATNRLKEDAKKSVMDIYVVDITVNEMLLRQMDNFFKQAFDLRKESTPIFTPYGFDQADTASEASDIASHFTQSQIDLLMSMDTLTFNDLQDDLTAILTSLLERGIRADGEDKILSDAREQINQLNYIPDIKSLASDIIVKFIDPNLVLDQAETDRLREEKAASVVSVIHLKNQKIVDENEIITEEMYEMLEALGFVSKSYVENILPSVGAVMIIATIFVFSIMYMNYFHKDLKEKRKNIFLIFTLYVLIVLFTWAMISATSYFLVPILIFTMLISMLISYRLSIFLNFSISIITLLIFKGDIDYLIYYLISGTVISILAGYTTERNKIILVGLISGIVNVCILVGYTLFFEASFMSVDNMGKLANNSVFAVLSGLLSVIIATGSLPVWEAVFGIITPLKLLDLTNPNNEILNRLIIEAPGTYHHSLIVANLAETAAFDIGANPAVARVGGYYHDIGKLKYPQYFSENTVGDNPHDSMDTYSSVQVIKSHVDFGLEMADSYKLPAIIKDMIAQHHGTTLIKYFYIKTKNENPDGEINESDFRYNHQTPGTKEAAVVMLADTVEAAVRSMIPMGNPINEVEVFVRSLIKDKLDDGQLINSGLTIKDLDTTAKSFMRVFKGMYHERIPYPKEKKRTVDKDAAIKTEIEARR